jgi:hypothetical protein
MIVCFKIITGAKKKNKRKPPRIFNYSEALVFHLKTYFCPNHYQAIPAKNRLKLPQRSFYKSASLAFCKKGT